LYDSAQRARFLPDGRIELVGAVTDSVELRGFDIDTVRIEAVLRQCPGVADVEVMVRNDIRGCPRLAAHVVAEGDEALPPGRLRAFLWSRLPGYAWPADLVGGDGGKSSGEAEQATLAALWAEVVGVERVCPAENYWQAFPFLDVVTRAAVAGMPISSHRMARNRTVATLAVDLAARRVVSGN